MRPLKVTYFKLRDWVFPFTIQRQMITEEEFERKRERVGEGSHPQQTGWQEEWD